MLPLKAGTLLNQRLLYQSQRAGNFLVCMHLSILIFDIGQPHSTRMSTEDEDSATKEIATTSRSNEDSLCLGHAMTPTNESLLSPDLLSDGQPAGMTRLMVCKRKNAESEGQRYRQGRKRPTCLRQHLLYQIPIRFKLRHLVVSIDCQQKQATHASRTLLPPSIYANDGQLGFTTCTFATSSTDVQLVIFGTHFLPVHGDLLTSLSPHDHMKFCPPTASPSYLKLSHLWKNLHTATQP